ncbi:hypothetical protein H2200_010807 [Cladophialophora chaetospira]|uniref:BD-FAE-like domain-containing protein n=1 Tax=Cladophialophora chaetospira TaxID=386627 RepID=A0AA38X0V6_9EURO|nr:hypothetical protein H2200_010807 [Cladophialophora chaetospira]
MDRLPTLGRAIPVVVGPTYDIYAALLSKKAVDIKKTTVETHKYGLHPRQQLDLYKSTSNKGLRKPAPILVFLYGGGFVNGDRILNRIPGELAFANLGHFFCENFGFETIVMDYRLVGHGATFPSGGSDLEAVMQWIRKRYAGSGRKVFVLGNSAGGIHTCTWMFENDFRSSRRALIAGSDGIKLAGVITLGAAFTFRYSSRGLIDSVAQYLGSEVENASPLGSIERCRDSGELLKGGWPRMLVVDSEFDPEDILRSSQDALLKLRAVEGLQIEYQNLTGHNHISPPLALGTGITEEKSWGFAIGKWCMA